MKDKVKGSSRAPRTSTNPTFTTEEVSKQETLSQQQEVDNDSSDQDTREDRNNQQGQGYGSKYIKKSGLDSSSNSGSSSALSVRNIL